MPRNYRRRAPARKSVVKTVKSVLNRAMETKHTDRSVTGTTYGNLGSVYNLSGVAGGSAEDQRVGEKITINSVRVTAVADANVLGTATQTMRILIFRDNFADGNIPTMTQVLESTGNTNATISNYNIDYHKRFTVLKDCFFNLAIGQKSVRQMCVSYKKSPCWFTGANSGDEGKGQIYLGIISDQAANYPNLGFTSRLTYKDA